MRKIAFVLMSAFLLVSAGCKNDESPKIPESTTKKKSEPEVVVYEGIQLDVEPVFGKNEVSLKVTVENTSKKPLPLTSIADGELFEVMIIGNGKTTLVEEKIKEENRKVIQPKEKVVWKQKYSLKETAKNYEVKVLFLLKDTEKESFKEEELSVTKVAEGNNFVYTYLPDEKQTYVYQEFLNGQEIIEEFLYFQEGTIQTTNSSEGTKIYFQDETGLYVIYRNEEVADENIIDAITPEKRILLPFPIEIGSTWESDNVMYEVTSTSEVVNTPYQTYENVVKVTTSNSTDMYYHESVGLIQVDYNGQTVMSLSDIKKD